MKRILMALAITVFAYSSVDAQSEKQICGTRQDQVCRRSSGKAVSCYKTKFAENYKVCKNDGGYYICCEAPNGTNSTRSASVQVNRENDFEGYMPTADEFLAPVSQSYNVNRSSSYEGYYETPKSRIKACYGGNNVGELTRNPWHGCPSPENDGVDKNKQRNVNVVYAAGQ